MSGTVRSNLHTFSDLMFIISLVCVACLHCVDKDKDMKSKEAKSKQNFAKDSQLGICKNTQELYLYNPHSSRLCS